MALKAENRPSIPMVAGEAPHPLPDRKPQFLDAPGGERLVVLFERDYEILLDAARDNLADAEAAIEAAKVLARIESGEERTIPFAVLQRITGGENPVKVLREAANLTQADLARAVDSSAAYISQIETGAARGGRDMLAKIADFLGAPIDLIMPKASGVRIGADLAGAIAERTGWSRSQAETFIDSMSNDPDERIADIASRMNINQGRLREVIDALSADRLPPGHERLAAAIRARRSAGK